MTLCPHVPRDIRLVLFREQGGAAAGLAYGPLTAPLQVETMLLGAVAWLKVVPRLKMNLEKFPGYASGSLIYSSERQHGG